MTLSASTKDTTPVSRSRGCALHCRSRSALTKLLFFFAIEDEYDQQGYQGEGGGAQGWQEWSAASSSSTWAQRVDESGNVYYENAETGETQWEQPASTSASLSASTSASLASGYEEGYGAWEEAYDENGSLYYVNATTGEVSYNY